MSGESRPENLDSAIRSHRHYHHATRLAEKPVERRTDLRFELQLDFDIYALREAEQPVWLGTGQTINWNRNNILIRCSRLLSGSSPVQLVVRWSPGVQLVVAGRVIRSEERGVLVRIERRRFRGKPAWLDTRLSRTGR